MDHEQRRIFHLLEKKIEVIEAIEVIEEDRSNPQPGLKIQGGQFVLDEVQWLTN